jgi:hypothetical protein
MEVQWSNLDLDHPGYPATYRGTPLCLRFASTRASSSQAAFGFTLTLPSCAALRLRTVPFLPPPSSSFSCMNSPSSDVDYKVTTDHGSPDLSVQRLNSVRTAEPAAQGGIGSSVSTTHHGIVRVSSPEIQDSQEPESEQFTSLLDDREIPDSQEPEPFDISSPVRARAIADSQESEPFDNSSHPSIPVVSDAQQQQSSSPESSPKLRRSRRAGKQASRPVYNDAEAFNNDDFEDPEFTQRHRAASDSDVYEDNKAVASDLEEDEDIEAAASDPEADEDIEAAASDPEEDDDIEAAASDPEDDDVPEYTPGDSRKKAKARRRQGTKARGEAAASDPEEDEDIEAAASDPEDDDIPEYTPGYSRNKLIARRRQETKEKGELKAMVTDVNDTPKLEPLLEIAGHQGSNSNISRWNQAIGPDRVGLKLNRVVLPTRMMGRIDHVRDLLRAPVVDGRRLSMCVVLNKRKWRYSVMDHSKSSYTISVSGPFYKKPFLRDDAEAVAVGNKLCRYLERLPLPLETVSGLGAKGKATDTAMLLQVAVLSDVYGGTDWVNRLLPQEPSPKGFPALQIVMKTKTVIAFTPVITNKGKDGTYVLHNYSISFNTNTKLAHTSAPIPPLDPNISRLYPDVFDAQQLSDKKIPSAEHQSYIRAANVLLYVRMYLYGAVGTFRDIQRLKDILIRPFLPVDKKTTKAGMSRTSDKSGPYNDTRLMYGTYESHPAQGYIIRPSTALERDVEGKLPSISILTRSKTRMAFVIQMLYTTYYNTNDALIAWRKTCELADRVSKSLLTSEEIKMNYCQCSEDERERVTHICQRCFEEAPCVELETNEQGNLVCRQCIGDASKVEDVPADQDGYIQWKIWNLLKHDKSIAKEDCKKLAEKIWAHLQQYRLPGPDGKWRDLWADTAREFLNRDNRNSRRSKRASALSLSFDGILPYTVVNGKVLYHANPANICLTAMYLNLVKGDDFPVVLGLIRQVEDMRASPSAQTRDNIINQFDHFHARSSKYITPNGKVLRLKLPVRKALDAIDHMKQLFIHPSEVPDSFIRFRSKTMRGAAPWELWSEQDRATIECIIGQAERQYSKVIPKGPDGAPWIWIPFHMPPDWSWHTLSVIMGGRFWRMRNLCNAKWETIDNCVTVFLELVLQYFRNDEKDEYFGLPMTIYIRHQLNFSIGHRQHGQQMRTGFKTLYPTSLDEDYDEDLNNICFETTLSNRIKWGFDDTDYEAIHQDLRTVHLQTEHYSVPVECPRLDIQAVWSRQQKGKRPAQNTEDTESDDDYDEADNESD